MLTKRKITGICSLCAAAILTGVMGASSITYAQEQNSNKIELADTNWTYEFWLGDINDDKQVDLNDASKVLKYALRIESENKLENFLADYDANTEINLQDANLALETALRIRDKEKCTATSAFPAYINDDVDMSPFMKWISSSSQLEEHVQMYSDESYKGSLLLHKDFLDFKDSEPIIPDTSSNVDNEELKEIERRGIIAANVEIPECREYNLEWLYHKDRRLLYIWGMNPLENNNKIKMLTYGLFILTKQNVELSFDNYVKTTQE